MFFPEKILRLVTLQTGKSAKGNDYAFVTLADKDTYENVKLMLGKNTDVKSLVISSDYKTVLSIDGDFISVNLAPVSAK